MKRNFFLVIAMFFAATTFAQTPILGEWITVDDNSGEHKSVVRIYQADNGKYYGDIIELFGDPNAVCVECEGADHNHPIVGLTIIRDMQLVGEELKNGKVLEFDCKSDGGKRVRLEMDLSANPNSRCWVFVPEDHIVGKALFVWLSLDKDRGWFDGKIRWNRLFRSVNSFD